MTHEELREIIAYLRQEASYSKMANTICYVYGGETIKLAAFGNEGFPVAEKELRDYHRYVAKPQGIPPCEYQDPTEEWIKKLLA